MDNESPADRVERTFWTVWYYITGAVSRFFRSEPANIVTNDPNSVQESAVDSEPANCDHTEDDAGRREVDEEQHLATASVLSSSQPVVAWDLCTTDIDLGPDEESKTQQSRGSESEASDEGEGTREEQFVQTGSDDAGHLGVKEDDQEEHGVRGLDETPESDEHEERTGDAMSEDVEENRRKAGAEEETERAVTPDDQKMDETTTKIHVTEEDDKMHHEDEQDLKAEELTLCTIAASSIEKEDNIHVEEASVQQDEAETAVTHEEVEDSDGAPLLLASENESKSDDGPRQVESQLSVREELSGDDRDFKGDPSFASLHVKLQTAHDKSGIVSEDELIVVEQECVMAHRSESEKAEDVKEGEIKEENVNEAANNQTIDEAPEQDIESDTEDCQEEDISTAHVTCSEEVVQNAKTTEFTDGEQEDVTKDTKTRESDDVETERHDKVIDGKSNMTTDISIDERFFDKDQEEEERLDKERSSEAACATTSVTVKPEGETGQEISGESKNTPLGICEGRTVVSRELNSPTCEETQEGVPEYNNEPAGPDENTTQRFLEVGDCEEIHITQLQEEEESKEPESPQNRGCSTGAEHMEEEQESREDIKNSFDLVVEEPEETEKTPVEPVIQESGLLVEEEEGKLLVDPMKTGIEHSEKEFESDVGLTKELHDGTEELLVDFERDEGLCVAEDDQETTGAEAADEVVAHETLNFLEASVQKMTEMSFSQESVDAVTSEESSYRTTSLLEDLTESGFLIQSDETESKVLEDSPVEMQDAGIDVEERGYGVEEEVAEDGVRNRNEMEILHFNLQVAGMAAELTTERNTEENTLIAEVESLETKYQLSGEALEISNDESKLSESKPKDLTLILAEEMAESEGRCTEETVSPVGRRQDVIDEEILDLWIQTALSEDTDDIKQQEGPEPGQQMDMKIEPSNEDRDEISSVQTETDKEQLMESNSDTEMSSSTAESGFSDQSLCEYGTQNSETQLLKSTSTGSIQGVYDMLANMSETADISELSTQQPNSESQDILMKDTADAGQSYLKEEETVTETGVTSSEAGPLDQESDKSQEQTDEEIESQKETDADVTDAPSKNDWKDTEVEQTKVEDEPLEMTASDSPPHGAEHTDSGRSRSGSEASLQDGNVSTDSGSQGDTCTESEKLLMFPSLDKPQPGWSEDITDSLPELNEAEVAEQLMTESEDLMEVDASLLDFTAQRSRIAIKNPRVRPPKDPRSLLNMPSVDPTPSSHLPVKVPAGVPLGGLGIGIKLPGLGAGFPVLKKTQRVVRDENSPDTLSQEPETKPEETSNSPKQDEAQHRPKWMPPGRPGFGNPLMSELKTKLKKTTKE